MSFIRKSLSIIAAAAIVSGTIIVLTGSPDTGTTAHADSHKKILVYYFHNDFRCYSCTQIETLTRKAVTENFQKELAESTVELKVINVDKAENEHFVEDYNLETKSVIMVEYSGSKQVRWKNLSKIWDYFYKEDVFASYIRDELNRYLESR
jgi:hypothetical protein